MIKAKELRVGNLVEYYIPTDNLGWVVNKVDWQDIRYCQEENESFNSNHRAIKLNEEWLIGLGFEKEKNVIPIYSIGKISIYFDCEMYPNGRVYFNSWCILKEKPKHVHELQNLYFALTGEELTIKKN